MVDQIEPYWIDEDGAPHPYEPSVESVPDLTEWTFYGWLSQTGNADPYFHGHYWCSPGIDPLEHARATDPRRRHDHPADRAVLLKFTVPLSELRSLQRNPTHG